MYKVSVPITNRNVKRAGREKLLEQLKNMNAERVFLALSTYELDPKTQNEIFSELADNCAFFKSHGFEVGAWIWTFWVKESNDFCKMQAIDGAKIGEFVCPTDKKFVDFASEYIKSIAKCNVDIIMFDDDFRYAFLANSPACLCNNHVEIINKITGKDSSREELCHHIMNGKKNIYRDAYIKANGDVFRSFAQAMRLAVNSVDPTIRLGACSCLSSWDIDGISAHELSVILAGDTKPFLRLIGAPYWAARKSWGNRLADVIELERMESAWSRNGDIEIMAEGDAYPRPRTLCPASFVEGFDTAIRASGCTDGILKYALDYCSNADYENGYVVHHQKNTHLYNKISTAFNNKTSVGVRVYEYTGKFLKMDMDSPVKCQKPEFMFFSAAARTLAYNCVPTVYEGAGVCGIVFDENARHIPLDALKGGMIIDAIAAKILTERGVDVGITRFGSLLQNTSAQHLPANVEEHFLHNDNHILSLGSLFFDIEINKNAKVLSDTACGKLPVSYIYENANGERFLVLNINTRIVSKETNSNLLYHYERARQYASVIPWLSGKELPAFVYGCPYMYIQCKEDKTSLSVGLWNFFEDTAFNPTVELSEVYSNVEFISGNGVLDGDKVVLNDIIPYGFCGFVLKK